MSRYVDRVEPYFLSDDPFVQKFAFDLLEGTYLASENTIFTGFEAIDRGVALSEFSFPIIPHLKYLPLNEEAFLEVVNRLGSLNKKDEDRYFYYQMLSHARTDLLTKYEDMVKSYFPQDQLNEIVKLPSLNDEELKKELTEVANTLEDEGFIQRHFNLGKRIIDELLKRNAIEVGDVLSGINERIEQEAFFDYQGIYLVYIIGEMKEESILPPLIGLFRNNEEGDLLFEELVDALVKIGTEQVVEEVEKVALFGNTFYHSLNVLGRMRTKQAEDTLLRLLDKADDLTAQTMIADALCQHLSTEAIPKVEGLLETGYDDGMLCLEETLYVNCIMNHIDHPKLPQWRSMLEKMARWQNQVPFFPNQQPILKTEKTGRNDPCPCGSGKKYKKCCL